MKKPQTDRILQHLKKRKTITTLQAMKNYGVCRLSERVRELKAAGHQISAYWAKERNSRVYKYYLAK